MNTNQTHEPNVPATEAADKTVPLTKEEMDKVGGGSGVSAAAAQNQQQQAAHAAAQASATSTGGTGI